MALGLLLWFLLLLDFSPVFSTTDGGQYQSLPDAQIQLGDEFFNALPTDHGDGVVWANEPSGPAFVRFKWPLPPANKNPPNKLDQKAPQTPPVNAKPPARFGSPNAAEWSGQGNDIDSPFVYESLPQKPSSPKKVGQPSYKNWMSMPFSEIFDENLFFGHMGFLPENSVNPDKYWVPLRFPQMPYQMPPPPPPPPSRKSLIRKSKNGYHRGRLLQSKDSYWSDVGKQQMTDAKNFNPLPRRSQNPQASRKV